MSMKKRNQIDDKLSLQIRILIELSKFETKAIQ
jgi:hypothetical protein